jgi:regulator of nucleoside diphosphate kinase
VNPLKQRNAPLDARQQTAAGAAVAHLPPRSPAPQLTVSTYPATCSDLKHGTGRVTSHPVLSVSAGIQAPARILRSTRHSFRFPRPLRIRSKIHTTFFSHSLGGRRGLPDENPTITHSIIMNSTSIYISSEDHSKLRLLLSAVLRSNATASLHKLREELDRAIVVDPSALPADVVTMGSTVQFEDLGSGEVEEYTLTFPDQANIEQKRLSILAPIGTAPHRFPCGRHRQLDHSWRCTPVEASPRHAKSCRSPRSQQHPRCTRLGLSGSPS